MNSQIEAILNSVDDSETNEDEEIEEEIIVRIRRPRVVRRRTNHFELLDDFEFRTRFRLSKHTTLMILNLIEPRIASVTNRNQAISPLLMLLITLRFYASGSFLITVGDFVGVHKSTISRIVHKVSVAVALLRPAFISMPNTEEMIQSVRQGFYNIAKFPRCIGAIDCTHIKIQSPGGDNAEMYRNRKNFFSCNVQTISSYDLKIRNIVARWSGSAHKSAIFRNSRIRASFERGEMRDSVIVGDGGYPIRPFLITPLANPVTAAEKLFNTSQIRTRIPVERCHGVWKRRFPILAMGIRVDIQRVEAIIVATAVLHNIAIDMHEATPPVTDKEENEIVFVNNMPQDIAVAAQADYQNSRTRHMLIHDHFANL